MRTFITVGVFIFLLISYSTFKIEAINYAWPRPIRNCKGTTLKRNGPRTVKSAGLEKEFLTMIPMQCYSLCSWPWRRLRDVSDMMIAVAWKSAVDPMPAQSWGY